MTTEENAKQLDWQAEKLHNRINRAMHGQPAKLCGIVLADLLYSVAGMLDDDPTRACAILLANVKERGEPKPEPSRIIVP